MTDDDLYEIMITIVRWVNYLYKIGFMNISISSSNRQNYRIMHKYL